MNETWSIAFWIALVVCILLIAFFGLGVAVTKGEEGRPMLALLLVACIFWLFLPWGIFVTGGTDYHKFKPKTGVVAEVGKRMVAKDKGMEEKIVIRFEGDPQEYGVSDTRAGLLKAGDTATVKCKRSYQFASESGYDCRWVSRTPKGN
jgi:hypothetical protein